MINISVICMNPLAIKEDSIFLISHGIKKLHFDIMDNHYVPRFGLFPEIHQYIEQLGKFESDCHFMVNDVARSIQEWCKYVIPDKITIHYKDNRSNLDYLFDLIKELGSQPILAIDLEISPSETLDAIAKFRPSGIMLLGIIPGVLKQRHQPELVCQKLALIKSTGILNTLKYVQVDGGVNFKTIKPLVNAGANELICGSSTVFKVVNTTSDIDRYNQILKNITSVKSLINEL